MCGVWSTHDVIRFYVSRSEKQKNVILATYKLYAFVKSRIFPPLVGGDKGEGEHNCLKCRCFYPHPNPLPSREREFSDFLRSHQSYVRVPDPDPDQGARRR